MNITNFLPSSGSSSAIIKSAAGGLIPSVKKQQETQVKKTKQQQTTLRKELLKIRSKTIKIEKLLQNSYVINQKKVTQEKKEKENEKRKKQEKRLKKKKTKVGNIEIPSIPQFGFLDAIKRFIFFTFLGLALPTLIKIAPKIIEFGKFISPAVKFFGDIGKGLLNGLVTFIDWGYKIQDSVANVAKQLGGDGGKKQFESFVKTLNTFIDLSILAGLTALDVGLDAERFRKQQLQDGKKKGERKPPVKPTTGQGGRPGLGRGADVTQGRGGRPVRGGGSRVTTGGGVGSQLSSGPFSKFAGPIKRFLGAAAPGAGAVIGALDAKARFESGDKIGGTLAATSAALDTFAAAVGVAALASSALALTGIGAAVPAALVSAAGIAQSISFGIDLVLLVRDLVKTFFPNIPMFSNGGRIKLLAQGGRVGEKGRSIKVSRRTPKVQIKQDINPGKDVGGKRQILKLFPDPSPENKQQTIRSSPWWERWLGGGQNNNQQQIQGNPANPFKALSSTAKTLSKIPGPVGLLMSAGSLIPLGQKPDKNIGMVFGNMMGKLTQDIIDNNINLSFSDITRFISGYANGGDLRSANIVRENNIGPQVGEMVGKSINMMISTRVDEAVRDIFREISTIGKPEDHLRPTVTSPTANEIAIDVNPDDIIGKVGSTGLSSAPHIHIEDYSTPGGSIPTSVSSSVLVNGKPMTSGVKISSVGWRRHPVLGTRKYHAGEDWDNNWNGKPISLTGGLKFVKYVSEGSDPRFSGYGNVVVIQSPDGKKYFLGHLSSGPANLQSLQQRQQTQRNQQVQQMRLTGNTISGQASWYGKDFHGKKTSIGEIYDLNKLTAAMSRPGWNPNPLNGGRRGPYWVEVTNTANNKKVRVKVNDSGPYESDLVTPHRTRVIDLSKAAFAKIASTGSGVINVTVQKLGAAARTTQPAQQPPGQSPDPAAPPPAAKSTRPSTAEQLRGKIQTQQQKNWTPPKDSIVFTIPGKGIYYADMKSNIVYDSNGTPIDVSGGKDRFVLEGLEHKRQTNPELFRTSASLAPTKPSTIAQGLNETPYYESQQVAFVPIIINKPVPVSTGMVNNNNTNIPSTVNFDITPSIG